MIIKIRNITGILRFRKIVSFKLHKIKIMKIQKKSRLNLMVSVYSLLNNKAKTNKEVDFTQELVIL